MSRVFIDTNIPMYAGGGVHPLREPAQAVIKAIAVGDIDAVTDAEVFQEILYRYLHIGQSEKGFQVFDYFYQVMDGRILPIESADVHAAREWAPKYPHLGARDLIHLGVMVRNNISEVLTADEGFSSIAEVRRITPFEFAEINQ